MVHGLETLRSMNRETVRTAFQRQPIQETRPLVVSIDYDDTYTADKPTWDSVIKILQAAGHTVICVSSRRDTLENRQDLLKHLPPTLTGLVLAFDKPKRLAALDAGYRVDIWIDDRPATIASKEEMLALVG